MSRHAQALGYDALILFLDELQEAVVPVGVFVGPGEVLDGWEPVSVSYPTWWFAEQA